MCKELEAIGLPDPVFNNNTFILKTTVRSSSFEHKSTGYASIQTENASIGQNDASIQAKDASIGRNDAPIQIENTLFQKKDRLLDNLKAIEADGSITPGEAKDAGAIISDIDIMQVITTKEVMKILACQTTKARLILKMMKKQGLIKDIPGKGKGRYILNTTN